MRMTRRAFQAAALVSLLAVSAGSEAKLHAATACHIDVAKLDRGATPLSYDQAAKVRGARIASNGTVFLPVTLPNARVAIYAIEPNGCAQRTNHDRWLR